MKWWLVCSALIWSLHACTTGECSADSDCAAGSTCMCANPGAKGTANLTAVCSCNECPIISVCEIQPTVGCPVANLDMVGQACTGSSESLFEVEGPGTCSCGLDDCTEARMYCLPETITGPQ